MGEPEFGGSRSYPLILPHYWGLGGLLNHSAGSGEELAIEVLLVQVLVLGFTAALWWIARRDLASRVPPMPPPDTTPSTDTAELEQLCATLETLVTSLARRLDAVERAARRPAASPLDSAEPAELDGAGSRPDLRPDPVPDPRYEPVYALLASGIADPVEIARRTGLGRGEVDLILSLRDRRAF